MNAIKNFRIYKKALAFFMAVSLMTSALLAFGEGKIEENTNEPEITEVLEEQEDVQRSYDDFVNDVNGHIEDLKKEVKKMDAFISYFRNIYVNLNYKDYADVRKELANDSLIANNNSSESYNSSYWFTIYIMDNNIDYLDKKQYDKVFDIGKYIRNKDVRELVRQVREKYFEVYEAGTIENESYEQLLELLKELKKTNYEAYYHFYIGMNYLLKHCVLVSYPKNRISKAFKYEKKNKLQLTISGSELIKILGVGPKDLFEQYIILILDDYNLSSSDEYEKYYNAMIQEIYTSS